MTKTIARIVAGGAVLLSTLAPAPADAQSGDLRVLIPFAFSMGEKTLPAGQYVVSRTSQFVLLVRGHQGGAMVLGDQRRSRSAEETRLVFHRYGDAYFLRLVHFGGQTGYALRETKEERARAERVARLNPRPEQVSIAAELE